MKSGAFGGWAHCLYLISDAIDVRLPHGIALCASDQGWGNTGHSYVAAAIVDPSGKIKAEHRFGTACHAQEIHRTVIKPAEMGAKRGDRIAVVLVSAPYGGYSCKGYAASIAQG